MPDTLGVPRFDELSRQWLALAERRLAYFSELYRSGRWQRYYTAESFADQVVDVMKAVTVWRELVGQGAVQAPVSASDTDDLHPVA
jgi:uncharacterized repeat protein (TIGR03809 family)